MKTILTFLFVLLSFSLFSQEFKYTLTLPPAVEAEVIKKMSKTIYAIFDQSGEYDVLTSQFIILSDVDITEEIFLQKMEELGYKRVLFSKQENLGIINE